jgi:rhamnulokinase
VSSSVHVAIDLGAESGRALVGRFDGERLALEELARFPNRPVRLPDGLRWNVLGLYDGILTALASAHASGTEVRSVGIDSWGVDFGLLDSDGALIGNPLHHRDGRGRAGMERALALAGRAEIYETTGIQFMPINTSFQLVALAGSSALDRARTLLLIPDLLACWLTGESRAEATNASTTQLLDVRTGDWARPLIERLEIPAGLFPPVLEAGSILGCLLGPVVEATGLPRSTLVAAVASHDTASAVVAAPMRSRACAYISSGTWSLVGLERDTPVLGPRALGANLTNERGFGATIRLLKNVMGLWLVQECRRAWLRDGAAPDYAELVEQAASAPPDGPLFDPDQPELLTPGEMPSRIRALCVRSGQRDPVERGVLLRAIFESLACKYRHVLDELEAATGETIGTIHVTGGGSQNAFLCQLTADICDRLVLAGPVEAAALGNVLVQLHAFGELGSLDDMRELVRRSIAVTSYEPAGDRGPWPARYERFRTLVESHISEEATR